jgi:hypothetical protein
MIDQYMTFVKDEGRDNLGDWITCQQNKNLGPKQTAAHKVLHECGVPVAELRQEWEAQKAVQSKLRSRAPPSPPSPLPSGCNFLQMRLFLSSPATHLEVVPHNMVAKLADGSLPDESTIACGTCAVHGRTCQRTGFNTNCDYCSKGGQVCMFNRTPEGFHRILESLRPLMDLSGGGMLFTSLLSVLLLTFLFLALSSVVMSAAQARRDMVQHYVMLTRAAHNFDHLCTKVVVLFNHQSSVLPLSHLEQMFEDPEDIQMLRALSDCVAEMSSKKALEAVYRHERPITTSGPEALGTSYYARHNCDALVRPSMVSTLHGSEYLSLNIFANAAGASLTDIDRAPSPDYESVVPKLEPGTSSVQGSSHVHFEQPPIATMSVASNSPPLSPDGLPSGTPVAPHTPVGPRQPSIHKFLVTTPARKRATAHGRSRRWGRVVCCIRLTVSYSCTTQASCPGLFFLIDCYCALGQSALVHFYILASHCLCS